MSELVSDSTLFPSAAAETETMDVDFDVGGEHSDWSGSYRRLNHDIHVGRCIVTGTNQGLHCRVRPHASHLIIQRCVNHRGESVATAASETTTEEITADTDGKTSEMMVSGEDERRGSKPLLSIDMRDRDMLRRMAESDSVFSYICGVAYVISMRHRVGGMVLDNYLTTLPLQKGLSSSAAVCVLVARAFNLLYSLRLSTEGEMDVAFHGERMTPSQCGRMDQCCAFGSKPISITFDKDLIDCKEMASIPEAMHLVVVDLCSFKDTRRILSDLNECFPFASNEVQTRVHEYLGPINWDITEKAISLMSEGKLPELGQLMTDCQAQFDDHLMEACPTQLKSPKLHALLSDESIQPFIYGGKGIGSQGDGSAQLLCKSEEDQRKVMAILNSHPTLKVECMALTIAADKSRVKTAIIPCATQPWSALFPATKCQCSALFPVLDPSDGLLKPSILVTVEQLLMDPDNDIDRVVLVVSEMSKPEFKSLFKGELKSAGFAKLTPAMRRYHSRIVHDIGSRVELVVQQETLGLGHAIYLCKDYLQSGSPVMLVLGDHLYRSSKPSKTPHTSETGDSETHVSCFNQVIHHFDGSQNVLGLQQSPLEDVGKYGTVSGSMKKCVALKSSSSLSVSADDDDAIAAASSSSQSDSSVITINEIVEKPSLDYARSNLSVNGLYFTLFGLYVIRDGGRLQEILAEHYQSKITEGSTGLIGLTQALERLRLEQEFEGVIIEGKRFDFGGDPRGYLQTLQEFSQSLQ